MWYVHGKHPLGIEWQTNENPGWAGRNSQLLEHQRTH